MSTIVHSKGRGGQNWAKLGQCSCSLIKVSYPSENNILNYLSINIEMKTYFHFIEVVYDRNQVTVSVTETKVQFLYQYWSRNFSFRN